VYSWGPSTDDWAKPSAYSFDAARKADMAKDADLAAKKGGRTYLTSRKAPDLELTGPRGKSLETGSENPILVAVDVTGSMAHWPAAIFDRLPLLYQTLSQYREDVEISFAAIGDATCDRYPLQVTDFDRGAALDEKLGALYGEGGGGGGARESYELFAWFLQNRVKAENAVGKPFLIIYGDEGFYPEVDPKQVQHYLAGGIEKPVSSLAVWRDLMERFNVYLLRKRYGSDREDKVILEQWQEALEPQRILSVNDEERAVDLALGLIARSWGRFADFERNMEARQPAAKVKALVNSLDARSKRRSARG
jgi:hypothetical protein